MTEEKELRVLLVEDDPDDALLLRRTLTPKKGYEVVHVRTGDEAISTATSERFDLVLLDNNLPDKSGVVVCKTLRASGYAGRIVMLSFIAQDAAVERALAAGADDYLVKQARYDTRLHEALRAVVGKGPA